MAKTAFPGKALRRAGERFLMRTIIFSQRRQLDYHPLPRTGAEGRRSERSKGSLSRLQAIREVISSDPVSPRVAMDIGSHIGFFAINLAKQGMLVHAVETEWSRLLLSFLIARREKAVLAPIALRIDRDTVDLLPEADITLCLSVWHHWVRRYGMDDATYILQAIIDKTRRFVFFDAGEEEMTARYSLPYGDESPTDYLSKYLQTLDGVDELIELGRHQAISPPDKRGRRHDVFRTLYCLRKTSRAAD